MGVGVCVCVRVSVIVCECVRALSEAVLALKKNCKPCREIRVTTHRWQGVVSHRPSPTMLSLCQPRRGSDE